MGNLIKDVKSVSAEKKREKICFKLFGGGISFKREEDTAWMRLEDTVPAGVGKKMASFLQYMIINHRKEVSSEELIEQFWPEDSSNDPAGVLKYTLHKARGILKKMFPEQENLLITRNGHYGWSPEVDIELDTEVFERACLDAKSRNEKIASTITTDYMLKMLNLYSSDLLTNNSADWVVPLRIYYRTLYIDACKSALQHLRKEDRWIEIVNVCEHAYALEPMTEEFTTFMMEALIAIKQPSRALEQYESYRGRLWAEMSLVPSEDVEIVHAAAVGAKHADEKDVIRMLTETEGVSGAFLCSFSVFRSIAILEARHLVRNHGASTVLVVRADRQQESNMLPATDVRRLERILLKSLRAGDPVARLDAGSYIVLLSGATAANAHSVMMRIEKAFRGAYPQSKARLDYKVYPLAPAGSGDAAKI